RHRSWQSSAAASDPCLHPGPSTCSIGVAVCAHDALVHPPRHIDLSVLLGSENCVESIDLLLCEQVRAGEQDAADAIERVPGPAAVSECLLLDPLTTPLHSTTGQRDDVERIHDRDGVGQLFGCG